MSEHAVLIPTSAGPIGGIVHEPNGDPRAALAFLAGAGDAGRSGVNSVWARTARAIAELGVTTLRVDYPGARESFAARGDWGDEHVSVLDEVVHSFRSRAPEGEFLLAGSCYGARLAFELIFRGVETRSLGIVIPEGNHPDNPATGDWDKFNDRYGTATEGPAELFVRLVGKCSLWACVGEKNGTELIALKKKLGLPESQLEVEVIPRAGSHAAVFRSADAQAATVSQIRAWVSRALGEQPVSVSGPPPAVVGSHPEA